ncbi:TPA: transcription antitermination factor NusB, partial [Patescibacteria group bacterium]|nr:transcription antitermination factor NusB [Patescibacteria group bacterium]
QMKLVDIQILRIAIFEGFIGKITPPKVAIDEAIELAKEFGEEVNGKFVNGVLGAIYEENKEDKND